jgi:hypothetical protein
LPQASAQHRLYLIGTTLQSSSHDILMGTTLDSIANSGTRKGRLLALIEI